MSELLSAFDAGESLFSQALRGVLPDELLLNQVAELIAADGPRVDPARLSDAIARLIAYRDDGLLTVREVKRGVVSLALFNPPSIRIRPEPQSARHAHDAWFESMREGSTPKPKPAVKRSVQRFETDYCVSREAVQSIVHLESRFGPLGRGFMVWAGVEQTTAQGVVPASSDVGDIVGLEEAVSRLEAEGFSQARSFLTKGKSRYEWMGAAYVKNGVYYWNSLLTGFKSNAKKRFTPRAAEIPKRSNGA